MSAPIGHGTVKEVWARAIAKAGPAVDPAAALAMAIAAPVVPPPLPGSRIPTPAEESGDAPSPEQVPVAVTKATRIRTRKAVAFTAPETRTDDTLGQYKAQSETVCFVLPGAGKLEVVAVAVEESPATVCVVFDLGKPGAVFIPEVGATLEVLVDGCLHKVFYPGSNVVLRSLGLSLLVLVKYPTEEVR